VSGKPVHPQVIRSTTLITVEGERDNICGLGQTHAAHDLCTGLDAARKHRLTIPGCGHYGIFSGNAWRTAIYPRVRDLIYQRAQKPHGEPNAVRRWRKCGRNGCGHQNDVSLKNTGIK
jgi:poly(3-hydroxybutyrate) depolymerase